MCTDACFACQGIGLSLDSALSFWRAEFAKGGMADDKFKKEHMYNIRHSYGKEGKRVNYTPASCMSVINSNPGEVTALFCQIPGCFLIFCRVQQVWV